MREFIINPDLEAKEIDYQYNKKSFDNYFKGNDIIQNNLSESTIKHKNYYGLFKSVIKDDYLIPNYNSIIFDDNLSNSEIPKSQRKFIGGKFI